MDCCKFKRASLNLNWCIWELLRPSLKQAGSPGTRGREPVGIVRRSAGGIEHGAAQGAVTAQRRDERERAPPQVRLPHARRMDQTPHPPLGPVQTPREAATSVTPLPVPGAEPESQRHQPNRQQMVAPPAARQMQPNEIPQARPHARTEKTVRRARVRVEKRRDPVRLPAHVDAAAAAALSERLAGHLEKLAFEVVRNAQCPSVGSWAFLIGNLPFAYRLFL